MTIAIRPEQYRALEAQRLHVFAAEVAATLGPIVAGQPAIPAQSATAAFALEQLQRAHWHGLKRRNEMMAWSLCAMVHGPDFEHRLPQVRQIIAEPHYDRSVLLTLLAMQGLNSDGMAA